MRTPLPDPKPNPFHCPIRAPKPRDCAWCAHREDCPAGESTDKEESMNVCNHYGPRGENIKFIKAVALTPSPTGLTLVGGNNNQGKTSVLDALAWALGRRPLRPDAAQREVRLPQLISRSYYPMA